jgi:hypothetical protein
MAINPIKILDEVLQGVSLTVNISAIVDNGGGSYTLTVDNTYYLNRLSTITIDAVEYTVTDFTINTELVVSGDSLPTATSFTINQPLFLYGNPQMVSAEIVKRQDNNTLTYPYIWAVEISTTSKNLNPSAAVKATKSFNLFFFDTVDRENWVIEDHYNQDIYPLSNYIDYFFTILKSRRDLFDSDSITWNETNHVNFGDYIQDQGNREKILNDNITGIQVQAEVPFMAQGCGFTSVTKNCLPVSVTFNGLSVTPTQSGGVKNVVVVNDAVPSVQVGSVTLDNENNLNIEVPAAGGDPVSTSMNGVGLTDTPAGETKAFTIRYEDDSPVVVTTITDNANTFIGEVPNNVSPVNTANLMKTGQVTAVYAGDDGSNQFGRNSNFTTLEGSAGDYPHNSLNRFCDLDGLQVYGDDIVVDMATWKQTTGQVLMWYRVPSSSMPGNTAISDAQTQTYGSFTDWFVPNVLQLDSIFNWDITGASSAAFNYAPFNLDQSTYPEFWTGTGSELAGRLMTIQSNENRLRRIITQTSVVYIPCRIGNISEMNI